MVAHAMVLDGTCKWLLDGSSRAKVSRAFGLI